MPSRVTRTSAQQGHPQSSFHTSPLTQVRVLYNSFAKVLFATRPVGNMHYSEDESSEIYISDEHPVDPDIVGVRPCITFTRGPIQFYSLGMDDMLSQDLRTGTKTKSVLIPGVMSINCCSRNDIESESTAYWLAEHLWLLREKLMGLDGFFEIGRQQQVSAPSSAEGIISGDNGREWYCTTVTSPFQFPRTSQFTPINEQMVNAIALQIQTRMQQLQCRGVGLGPAASPNADLPTNVQVSQGPSYMPMASDARGRAPDPGGNLPQPPPLAPHPLNPAVTVRVRTTHPYRAAVRPPSMGGRAIPIAEHDCVESEPLPPFRTKV